MSTSQPRQYGGSQASGVGGDVLMTIVSAGLFLYVGFGLGLAGISGNRIVDLDARIQSESLTRY